MSKNSKIILHCDMNNCYASIEAMLNPALRGKSIAVCGAVEDRHGIVLAKSESAKKLGVKTGEPIWQAKLKCPDLQVVPPHYDEYMKYSKLAQEIYYEYTDRIEPYGIDECWLDMSGSKILFGDGEEIANTLRQRMKSELGLTISVGVSFNKIFAKLGSDMKKPDAVTVITEDGFHEKIWHLPASEMLFVGKSTTKKLQRFGIKTIGDIAATNIEFLQQLLGKNGETLWYYANGLDSAPVKPYLEAVPMKSISNGITCVSDLLDNREVFQVILSLSQEVSRRLHHHNLRATGIQLAIKDSKLVTRQFQFQLEYPTQAANTLAHLAMELFTKNYNWQENVRALSVRTINLRSAKDAVQLDLFSNFAQHQRQETVDKTIYDLRQKFGKNAITRGTLLQENKIPKGKSDVHVMPAHIYT